METRTSAKKDYWDCLETCFEIPAERLDIRIIAILGIIPTIACACLGSPLGSTLFSEHGFSVPDSEFMSSCYIVLAMLAFFCHALLYLWYMLWKERENLFYICVSLMLLYLASSLCLAIVISAMAANSYYLYFAVTNMILWLSYSSVLMFFVMVVNSQRYALERISSENLFSRLSNQSAGQ